MPLAMASSVTSSQQTPDFARPQYFKRTRTNRWLCDICTSENDDLQKGRQRLKPMTLQLAMQHERNSAEHARNVSDADMWWNPKSDAAAWDSEIKETSLTLEEVKRREHQLHVDNVWDIVPFWMKGVQAAERGEVFSMEEFLESIKETPWESNEDTWGYAYSPRNWEGDTGNGGSWRVASDDPWNAPAAGKGLARDSTSSLRAHRTASSSGEDEGRKTKNTKRTAVKNGSPCGVKRGGTSVNGCGDAYAFVEDVARQQAADAERKLRMHIFFQMSTHDKIKKIQEVIRDLQLSTNTFVG